MVEELFARECFFNEEVASDYQLCFPELVGTATASREDFRGNTLESSWGTGV